MSRRVVMMPLPPKTAKAEPEPDAAAALEREDLRRVMRFLARLADGGFYGKLTLSFQNGKITDLRTEQAMKLEEL